MIIGLTGAAQSGKDTAAKFLIDTFDFHKLSFASPIRNFIADLCCCTLEELEVMKDKVHPSFGVTPRYMMQTLGTEWGRDTVNSEIWTQTLELKLKKHIHNGNNVIVTDIRFDNEAALINRYGVVATVIRPNNKQVESHSSEKGVNHAYIDEIISNSQDIGFLNEQIREIYLKHLPNGCSPVQLSLV